VKRGVVAEEADKTPLFLATMWEEARTNLSTAYGARLLPSFMGATPSHHIVQMKMSESTLKDMDQAVGDVHMLSHGKWVSTTTMSTFGYMANALRLGSGHRNYIWGRSKHNSEASCELAEEWVPCCHYCRIYREEFNSPSMSAPKDSGKNRKKRSSTVQIPYKCTADLLPIPQSAVPMHC